MPNATSAGIAARPAQIGASTGSVNTTQDPNKPPQVYQGPPPTHGGYDDAPPKSNAAPFYASGIFVAVLALFFVTRMLVPAPVQAIDALEAHTSKDKVFACQAPSGWEVEMGARSDGLSSSSLWTSGSARILISDDLGGSLMSESSPPLKKPKCRRCMNAPRARWSKNTVVMRSKQRCVSPTMVVAKRGKASSQHRAVFAKVSCVECALRCSPSISE